MIITEIGTVIRIQVSTLRVMGRATQGVRIINLRENDSIAAVAQVEVNEEDGIVEDAISEGAVE